MDNLEALTNAAIGLIVSWAVTVWALPAWGFQPSYTDGLGITALYFVVSFIRLRILRAVFRRIGS